MMPNAASERSEREDHDHNPNPTTADDVQRFMMGVFQLQAKVAEVGQMVMTLSAQAATLSGLMSSGAMVSGAVPVVPTLSTGVPSAGVALEFPTTRTLRGTPPPPVMDGHEAVPVPSPPANPGPRHRRPRATAAKAVAAPPNPGPPKPSAPKSDIELALAKRPLTTRLLAKATGLSVSAAAESAKALAEEGKVRNIGDPDHPVWMAVTTWPGLPWDRATSDALKDLVTQLLDGRNFSFEQLVTATGAPSGKVDQALTKLKFKDLVTIIEPESGRKLIYTLNLKPDPAHAHLKKKRYR